MKSPIPFTAFMLSLTLLVSCANMNTVTGAPNTAGISQVFTKDHESVKASVLTSMQKLNLNIKDTKQTSDGFSIAFTKSISLTSWGEVGRVLVKSTGNGSSQVFVHSAKRSRYQITGADQQDFADRIFKGVEKILNAR